MSSQTRVAIVGAGVVGLAHAWAVARRGHSVLLFERSPFAQGASIRNFGMVWPIGQSPELYPTALRSRQFWLEFTRDAGVWCNPCGSLHLAHQADEWETLCEFAELAPALGYECELWTTQRVLEACPAANPSGLQGGLFSATEACVNPREAIAAMPGWLRERFRVETHFSTTIVDVDLPTVRAADGRRWQVDRAIVCGGIDFQTLYPDLFARAALRVCKLQMMRTAPQPGGMRIGPLLAGGLTLRHYENFRACKSLDRVRERVAAEHPELDQYCIHVLVSQNADGEVILGDSHEYGDEISPFDKARIDELILEHAGKMLSLPSWQIAQRWHGLYSKPSVGPCFTASPQPNVQVISAAGGTGMTLSFGLAEEMWQAGEAGTSDEINGSNESNAGAASVLR